MNYKELFTLDGDNLKVKDPVSLRNSIEKLIYDAVFTKDEEKRRAKFFIIKEACKQAGAYPASIHELYEHMGQDYPGFTVPAMNIRGLTFDTCRTAFRKAMEMKVGPMIFEIARSEIGYTMQRPLEYSAAVLAAAVAEGYEGPVFIQGDHFQLNLKKYTADPEAEKKAVSDLIREALEAEFYNIDIDSSTLVDLSQTSVKEQQEPNYDVTSELSSLIRDLEPEGITVSIGGEIGEIGKENTNAQEVQAYLEGFKETFSAGKGLSKLSVQTGTSHGGVVLPDGSLAQVSIDFDTLRTLSDMVRKDYGLSGCVQHGASTLPDDAFHMFPETGTSEVHLATGFQNIVYDNPALPEDFRNEVYELLKKEFGSEWKEGQTEEQFIYKTRKKGFGPVKQKWWDLSADVKGPIMQELSEKFELLFKELRVPDTLDIMQNTITDRPIILPLSDAARALVS